MAKPTEDQRLDIEKCATTTPENASEYLPGQWYCDPGYRANIAIDPAAESNPFFAGPDIPVRTICIIDIPEDTGVGRTITPPQATGLGVDRSFFEADAIDRTYT